MNRHLERLYWITAVLAYFQRLDTQATPTSPNKFCFGDVCYIRTSDTDRKNWTDAQQICKAFNATLPIVNNSDHQKSFEAAVRNLMSDDDRNVGIWIGAKAFYSQPPNWTWLNGDKYYGTAIDMLEGDYAKSFAYVSITGNKSRAIASAPTVSYSYICHFPNSAGACGGANSSNQVLFKIDNSCHAAYYMYTEKLSWFGARNFCLTKDGDLASFGNISVLEGIIGHGEVWVGLQNGNNYWSWYNAVTDIWSDVTYTLWNSGQPNDQIPNCISTDTFDSFPHWRDWNCTEKLPFICLVVNTTATSELPGNPSSIALSGSYSTASSITMTTLAGTSGSSGSGIIPMAVGIGVGVGVPVIILIVVVIVIIVRRKHRNGGSFNNRTANVNSRSTKEFAPESSENNPQAETTEMNERKNGPTQSNSSSSAQYATISEATRLEQDAADPLPLAAASQGIVYAPLSFDQ